MFLYIPAFGYLFAFLQIAWLVRSFRQLVAVQQTKSDLVHAQHALEHRHLMRSIPKALVPAVPQERLDTDNRAAAKFRELLDDLIAYRRTNPDAGDQGEILGSLIFGQVDGRCLNDEEQR